jgi:hypothetical protein
MSDNFLAHFGEAERLFEADDFSGARAEYLRAIEIDVNDIHVMQAILRLERIEEILSSKDWYGTVSEHHAVCLLGSISGSYPTYAHNVFFGKPAYEAFHTYLYMQDLLRLRRYQSLAQPTFFVLYLAAEAMKSKRVEFLELGSTLYAAYEKFQNCATFAKAPTRSKFSVRRQTTLEKIAFIGVELSDWLRHTAELLHPALPIAHYRSWRDVRAPQSPRMALSIGVGGYAFETVDELARWVATNRVTILRERFTLGPDFLHQILGKRNISFDLGRFTKILNEDGFEVCLLSCAETGPFLDSADQLPSPDSTFFEPYLVIHDLNQDERRKFGDLAEKYGAHRLQSGFNTWPPFTITKDLLAETKVIDALSGRPCKRAYVKQPDEQVHDSRFNFSSAALRDGLAQHIQTLKMIYGGDGRLGNPIRQSF